MEKNLLHTVRLTVLFILTCVVFGAAIGNYLPNQFPCASRQACTKKQQDQAHDNEFKLSPSAEAVVVSNLAPDFSKTVLFSFQVLVPYTLHFSETSYHKVSINPFFKTLFTHIISPNAP